MAEIVYDEPTARRHAAVVIAPAPGFIRSIGGAKLDPRVVIARCGMRIALVGHPSHRPRTLTWCDGCWR